MHDDEGADDECPTFMRAPIASHATFLFLSACGSSLRLSWVACTTSMGMVVLLGSMDVVDDNQSAIRMLMFTPQQTKAGNMSVSLCVKHASPAHACFFSYDKDSGLRENLAVRYPSFFQWKSLSQVKVRALKRFLVTYINSKPHQPRMPVFLTACSLNYISWIIVFEVSHQKTCCVHLKIYSHQNNTFEQLFL